MSANGDLDMQSSSSLELDDDLIPDEAHHHHNHQPSANVAEYDEDDLFPAPAPASSSATATASGAPDANTPMRPPFNIHELSPPNSQGSPSFASDASRFVGLGGSSSPVVGRPEAGAAPAASEEDVVMETGAASHVAGPTRATSGGRRAPSSAGAGAGTGSTAGKGTKPAEDVNAPGYAWKNKGAQDAFVRAMESVVDPKFSLREFGDPFDERDMYVDVRGR